jgi:uncharacterized protein
LNILIDIGHPAHVHYYRNLANELINRGHKVIWTVKDIPVAVRLLDHYGFYYSIFPKKSDNILGKAYKQLEYNYRLLKICRKEKIDIAIGTSVSVAHVSKFSGVKSIVFDDDDDEVQPLVTKLVNPFADTLLSPDVLKGKRKRKDTVFYPGYHELAYLHPNKFAPDPDVLTDVGLIPGETFFIMRFNVFKAHHDIGINGLSSARKLELISLLEPHGKIFITTEREIEPELKKFQLKLSPEKIHSLMAYATVFLGDSQTMTSEAAVLGVPSLRCNSFAGKISYLEELEKKFGLTYAFTPDRFEVLLEKLTELLALPDIRTEWQYRRQKMLAEKIDVTSFWLWFITNYPFSIALVKNNPRFHEKFR